MLLTQGMREAFGDNTLNLNRRRQCYICMTYWLMPDLLARVLAIANRKGGTGKSTAVVNLGAELAVRGYRVLVVDLDPQGHAGLGFGICSRPGDVTIHTALRERTSLVRGVRRTSEPKLDVLPADRDFDGVIRLQDPRCLAKALAPLRSSYDMVLIDTPPGSANLIVCALLSADGVVVPTALEHLSLDGVRQFARSYHQVMVSLNAALLGLMVLPMRVDLRSTVQKDVLDCLIRGFGLDQVVRGVRIDTAVSEAFGRNQPLRRYKASARAVADFAGVADEVLRRFQCADLHPDGLTALAG